MTKEEFLKIKDSAVSEKVFEMTTNTFKAIFQKDFASESETLKVWFNIPWHLLDWKAACEDMKGLYHIEMKLTDWASASLWLGIDINENIRILKYIWEIKKLSGQTRVNEFKNRCEDLNVPYDIFYNKEKLYLEISKKMTEMGKGIFKIHKSAGYSRKFNISLSFDCDSSQKKALVTMQVFFSDHDDFLECLQEFVDECRKKKLDTVEKIQKEIDLLPLREYRLVTKRVLSRVQKEDKKGRSLPHNLGIGKFGVNLKKSLFAGNQSLEYVYLPQGMKEIPDSLFLYCENLRSVQIPESVEEIGYKAFYGCKNLKYVNLPKHLKSICSKAFAYCDSLPELEVPKHCRVSFDAFESDWDSYDEGDEPYYLDPQFLDLYGNTGNWY